MVFLAALKVENQGGAKIGWKFLGKQDCRIVGL
jgi:hypothetical protein